MATTDELLDALMESCKQHKNLIGENGLLKQLSGMSGTGSLQPAARENPALSSTQEKRG
jgi:hypothetical protein